jgi:hypothetical protein
MWPTVSKGATTRQLAVNDHQPVLSPFAVLCPDFLVLVGRQFKAEFGMTKAYHDNNNSIGPPKPWSLAPSNLSFGKRRHHHHHP